MADDHPDEPHTHTLTFRDNDGQAYSFDHDCPTDGRDIRDKLLASGAATVNDMAADGRVLPFETVLPMLGGLGLVQMLGDSYMTGENLVKLMVAMATHPDEEGVTA